VNAGFVAPDEKAVVIAAADLGKAYGRSQSRRCDSVRPDRDDRAILVFDGAGHHGCGGEDVDHPPADRRLAGNVDAFVEHVTDPPEIRLDRIGIQRIPTRNTTRASRWAARGMTRRSSAGGVERITSGGAGTYDR
jgi:hypothetical protein